MKRHWRLQTTNEPPTTSISASIVDLRFSSLIVEKILFFETENFLTQNVSSDRLEVFAKATGCRSLHQWSLALIIGIAANSVNLHSDGAVSVRSRRFASVRFLPV